MSVNSDTSPSVPRLDDETEHAIHKAVYSGCSCMTAGGCRYCTANVAALRSRVWTLIEEARVCPEDFGMEEYIPILEKRVRQQQEEIERLRGSK